LQIKIKIANKIRRKKDTVISQNIKLYLQPLLRWWLRERKCGTYSIRDIGDGTNLENPYTSTIYNRYGTNRILQTFRHLKYFCFFFCTSNIEC
jgi:hypothetical protein